MSYGLGFSQQQVTRKCNTVLYADRFKGSKFKKLGRNVMTQMKVTIRMLPVFTQCGLVM